MLPLLVVIGSYLVGGILGAYLLLGEDIFKKGSKNPGALNLLRITGNWGKAVAALLIDVFKAYGMLWLTDVLFPGDVTIKVAVAAALVLGHTFPVWTGFRGGRGVSVLLGIMLYENVLMAVLFFATQLVFYLLTGYISAALITTMLLFPGIYVQVFHQPPPLTFLVAMVVVWMRYLDKFRGIIEGSVPRHFWRVKG